MSVPLEIERKYVILMPDASLFSEYDGYTVSHIEQTYLDSPAKVTRRVRARSYSERTVYTETKKIRVDSMSALEDEREIERGEYLALLQEIKEGTTTLRKTRHTFCYGGQVFEIDVYPEWTKTAILETELPTRETVVEFPDLIRVVKEVTGDKKYSNAAMAREFPTELI